MSPNVLLSINKFDQQNISFSVTDVQLIAVMSLSISTCKYHIKENYTSQALLHKTILSALIIKTTPTPTLTARLFGLTPIKYSRYPLN